MGQNPNKHPVTVTVFTVDFNSCRATDCLEQDYMWNGWFIAVWQMYMASPYQPSLSNQGGSKIPDGMCSCGG